MNCFGTLFSFTSFGESHGRAIGGVLDGVPAGIKLDMDLLYSELNRRAGLDKNFVSPRAQRERDEVEWLSGMQDGITLGTPIAFLIRNTDAQSEDYAWLKESFRPGHADWTYQQKYGIRAYQGGGRASARETASRVIAGAIAKQILSSQHISICAQVIQIGEEKNSARFEDLLKEVQQQGDSIGGIVSCTITGLPAGIGEPIFDKLQAHLAFAMLSINGCKGFDYGTGFEQMEKRGSALYHADEIPCRSSGGIEGGISNGLPITFRCAFKPAATLTQRYPGRHDCCIALRAVPVVEAMTALVLQDMISIANTINPHIN